jgi:Arabinose efflux permease
MIMLLVCFAYGAIYTLIPDFGKHFGIKNKGLLFTFFTVASLTVRLIAGKASDKYGREPVLRISTFVMLISMLLVGFATSKEMLIAGVTLYGFAQGSTSPTLLAWATDLSDPKFKGRGISSLYIFMEFGIGAGAFLSGLIYGNDPTKFLMAFMMCAVLSGIAFVYLASRPFLAKA